MALRQEGKRAAVWFFAGAGAYPVIEVIWRGHSHWSMALAGGACTVLLLYFNRLFYGAPRLLRALACGFLICLVEFIFGIIFNIFFGLAVWDYSALPYHLMGQVCLRYFLLWCGLSFLLTFLFDLACPLAKKENEGASV